MRFWLRMTLGICIISALSCDRSKQSTSQTADVTQGGVNFSVSPPNALGQVSLIVTGPPILSSVSFCTVNPIGQCVTPRFPLNLMTSAMDHRVFTSGLIAFAEGSVVEFFTLSTNGVPGGARVPVPPRLGMPTIGWQPNMGLPSAQGIRWRSVLIASDQGDQGQWIDAFDNARKAIAEILVRRGVLPNNIMQLSLHPDQQSNIVQETSELGLGRAFQSLNPMGPADACLVHMTSHGSPDGFNLGYDLFSPVHLNSLLNASCGTRPTVVLISACYSGLYLLDEYAMKQPNRVILTAARSDLTSFGCGAENQYTYWDSCLVDLLPRARTWRELATSITNCISEKEAGGEQSFPQTFIGSQMETMTLPGVY